MTLERERLHNVRPRNIKPVEVQPDGAGHDQRIRPQLAYAGHGVSRALRQSRRSDGRGR